MSPVTKALATQVAAALGTACDEESAQRPNIVNNDVGNLEAWMFVGGEAARRDFANRNLDQLDRKRRG